MKEIRDKVDERFEQLGVSVLNYVFGRAKLYFLLEVAETKNICRSIPVSEDSLKEGYIKSLSPLKENVTANFKLIIDDMEHFRNIHSLVFRSE